AKSKGVRLGRPRVFISESRIDALRCCWRLVACDLERARGCARYGPQNRSGAFKKYLREFWNGRRGKSQCPVTQPNSFWSRGLIRSCSVSTRTYRDWLRADQPEMRLRPLRSQPIWRTWLSKALWNSPRCPG